MNPGSIASSAASSTASSAASSVASSAANQTASKAASAAGQTTSQAASQTASKTASSSAGSIETGAQVQKPSSKSIDDVIDTPEVKQSPDGTPDTSIDTLDDVSTPEGDKSIETSNKGEESLVDDSSASEPKEVEVETTQSGEQQTEKSWEEKLEEYQEELELEAEEEEQQRAEEEEELQPGDRVDFGKQIGEDGQVEDTNMKKTLDAAAKLAIIIGSEGSAAGASKAIVDNPASSKLIGVVSDIAEKNPALKATGDVLADTGISDLGNDAADIAADIANADPISAAKDVVKAGKNLKKNDEKLKKKMMAIIISVMSGIMALLFVVVVVMGPTIGGFMYLTDKLVDLFNSVKNAVVDIYEDVTGTVASVIEFVDYEIILNEIPDYNNLSPERQDILATAVSLIGGKYHYGGKPTGPGAEGVPSTGLDCSGFVEWVMWTALDEPASGGGTAFFTSDGAPYTRINERDLKPGDIAVKRTGGSVEGDTNHVGIYLGNNLWVHAANSSKGIIRSQYTNFTIFLRHDGVD